ncbi:MAG TPA: hypothetical protein VF138_13025 [Caulobacteraceae bacterium]
MSDEPRSWQPTAREAHAHMLNVAAARRLRALERAGLQRTEDAAYWKQLAPFAVQKAKNLRGDPEFPALP